MTRTRKIHIAGKPDANGQRCTRCHAQIEPFLSANNWWPVGALISSDGRGNMRVVDSEICTRPCGRKGAK